LPHILQANLTNLRTQGKYRHLLWNEVYETTLAWYILRPTLVALINPKLGKFNVTPKGGLVARSYFDSQIAKPYLFLLLLNLAGVVAGVLRLLYVDSTGEMHTIWFNLGWTAYNMMLLGATIATASETRQVRRSHRVPLDVTANLYLPDGRVLACRTVNFSTGGMAIHLNQSEPIEPGLVVQVGLSHRGVERTLPAVIRQDRDKQISVQFTEMSVEQERWLVASTFARADIWLSQWGQHEHDSFGRSVLQVLGASMRGFQRLGQHVVQSAAHGFKPARASDEVSQG
jgi:cellulose synthase (UDP-forming)